MRKQVALIFVVGVFAAAGGYWFSQNGADRAEAAGAPAAGARARDDAYPLRASNGETHTRASVDAVPDLFAEVAALRSRAESGDAKAAYRIASAYDQCMEFAGNPANFSRATEAMARSIPNPGMRKAYEAHRHFVSNACRGFAQTGTRLSPADVVRATEAAAEKGSLAAEIDIYRRGLSRTEQPGYEAVLLELVLASGDPDAMLALSSAMGAGATIKHDGRYAGTDAHMYAWQLSACQRGLECGPTSRLVTGYCANGGICGGSFDDLLRNHLLPRAEYDRIKKISRRIQEEM